MGSMNHGMHHTDCELLSVWKDWAELAAYQKGSTNPIDLLLHHEHLQIYSSTWLRGWMI